ncbi:MAG TPA: hypothetical protein EYQ21_05085 [Flavobacteriales bacterium]|nr:hypothetical protein [Flavobacteriales bacterium]
MTTIATKEAPANGKVKTPVVAKKATPRKSNHPENYDFTKVGEVKTLTVTRNGKEKKLAKQCAEIIQFAKSNRITKIKRSVFLEKISILLDTKHPDRVKNVEKYPQLSKSVQTMAQVVNFYWSKGTLKQIGVVGN